MIGPMIGGPISLKWRGEAGFFLRPRGGPAGPTQGVGGTPPPCGGGPVGPTHPLTLRGGSPTLERSRGVVTDRMIGIRYSAHETQIYNLVVTYKIYLDGETDGGTCTRRPVHGQLVVVRQRKPSMSIITEWVDPRGRVLGGVEFSNNRLSLKKGPAPPTDIQPANGVERVGRGSTKWEEHSLIDAR